MIDVRFVCASDRVKLCLLKRNLRAIMEISSATTNKASSVKWTSINIGAIGLLCAIVGNLYPATMLQKYLYLAGGVLLMISALLEKQEYFIALEVVVIVSALLAFLPELAWLKMGVPLLLSLFSIAYLYSRGLLNSALSLLGVAGLVFLGLGYAILNPVIYLLGGVVLTAYSLGSYFKGVGIALLWAILNAIFSVTALLTLV